MAKIRAQNSFNGGDSVDKFGGRSNEIINSRCVDIRTNSFAVRCAYQSQEYDDSITFGDSINKILNAGNYTMRFLDDGKIYRDGTLVYTNSGNTGTKNAIIFNDRLFWIAGNKLNNIAVSLIANNNWNTDVNATYSQQTFTNTAVYAPMKIVNQTFLYIGNNTIIASLDTSGVFTASAFAGIIDDDIITSLTYGGNFLRIYTIVRNSALTPTDGRQYYWDTVNTSATDIVEWTRLPVWNAIEYGGMDYVIAGIDDPDHLRWTTGLYKASGYSKVLIRKFNQSYQYGSLRYSQDTGGGRFPMLLDGDVIYVGTYGGIYKYGTEKPGFPLAWNIEYQTRFTDPEVIITDIAVLDGNGNLIYAWVRNGSPKTFGMDTVDISNDTTNVKYATYGVFETLPVKVGLIGANKSNIELYIGHSLLNTGESIEIQYRINSQSIGYTTLATITSTTTMRTVLPIRGDWNYIQFRVYLYAGTSNNTTPELYDLALLYDDNIKY